MPSCVRIFTRTIGGRSTAVKTTEETFPVESARPGIRPSSTRRSTTEAASFVTCRASSIAWFVAIRQITSVPATATAASATSPSSANVTTDRATGSRFTGRWYGPAGR